MIYKFKSRATSDLIMLAPQAEQFFRLAGREPAPQGVIEVEAMPQLLSALESAMAAEQDVTDADPAVAQPGSGKHSTGAGDTDHDAPGLRQRLWPMVEMLRRAHAAAERVVWGV